MSRQDLLEELGRYRDRWPEERACADRMRAFVARRPDCFERSCVEGHITASAWIVSSDGGSVLAARHRKLGMWLQLGGHADGEADTAAAALREAREESGLRSLCLHDDRGQVRPFDIDIHEIPARPGEPEHLHHDVRYLLRADARETLTVSEESDEVRWIALSDLPRFSTEESVVRMARKSQLLLT